MIGQEKKQKGSLVLITLAVVIVAGVIAFIFFKEGEKVQPKRESFVVGLKVFEQKISDKVEALGTAKSNESIEITSNTTETIREIKFEDGQKVAQGDALVVLDQSAELARLSAIKARQTEDERELKRIKTLLSKKAATKREYDERNTSLLIAKEELKEVQAEIDERTLTAPFDGVVGIRRLSVGALVQPGTVITTLDDTKTIKLDFTVPAIHLSKLEIGLPISATSDALGNATYKGEVISVNTRIDPITRSILVRAAIDNENGKLKPGLLMKVTLLEKDRQSVVIPEESIIQRGDKHFVFVVKDNKVEERQIEVGVREVGIVEAVNGLSADEVIVVRGMGEVRDGQDVTMREVWDKIKNSQFEEN